MIVESRKGGRNRIRLIGERPLFPQGAGIFNPRGWIAKAVRACNSRRCLAEVAAIFQVPAPWKVLVVLVEGVMVAGQIR